MTLSNIPQNLERNSRFLGPLDSAKTAHPVSSANEINNWWMPSDVDTHLLNCAAAEATAIKQVLWGEILQLPRNQSFDSPAWLNLADYLVESKLPLFSICVVGKSATPDAFVKDCAQQFEPTSPFSLSAWPDLVDDQRKVIAENIENQGNFKGMFDNVTLDSHWKVNFEHQQGILQRMLEYLEKYYRLEPQLIRAVDYAPTTTWQRIERDYTDQHFIDKLREKNGDDLASSFQGVLGIIKAKAVRDIGDDPIKQERWLSSRTNLYKEVYREPHELREILRTEIDRCYIETTSESVTDIGRFSDADRSDTQRLVDNRLYESLLVDTDNDPSGLREYYVVNSENLEFSRNSINDFLEVLNDKGVASRIRMLRKIRSLPYITAEVIADVEKIHLEALCLELPNVVIQRNHRLARIAWRTAKYLVNVVIGHEVNNTLSFLKDLYKEFVSEAASEVIDMGLDKAKADAKINELVFKRKRNALAGILRDWLTKDIVVNNRKPQGYKNT